MDNTVEENGKKHLVKKFVSIYVLLNLLKFRHDQ